MCRDFCKLMGAIMECTNQRIQGGMMSCDDDCLQQPYCASMRVNQAILFSVLDDVSNPFNDVA